MCLRCCRSLQITRVSQRDHSPSVLSSGEVDESKKCFVKWEDEPIHGASLEVSTRFTDHEYFVDRDFS